MALETSEAEVVEQQLDEANAEADQREKDVEPNPNASSAQAGEDIAAAGGNALRLAWTFGFQKDLINGVHSLSAGSRRAVFYAAAHTGVIYDYARRQQRLLQGHCHPISCCVVSEDKRWVVTADRGHESMLVVWDAQSGNPIRTIFRPHANGVQAIDISPDALFLVTLSAVNREDENGRETTEAKNTARKRFDQELAVWEWAAPASGAAVSKPLYSSLVATEDVQHAVRFNTYDVRELVTTGRQRVIFWSWAARTLLFYSPSLAQKDFRQVVGAFTQSLFVPDSAQALTGTEDGDLVLWDAVQSDNGAETPAGSFPERKAVKIVRLAGGAEPQRKVALTALVDMDGYLVIGSSDGAVRFYDFDFRLVAWFEDMNAGPVTSVSFALPANATNGDADSNLGRAGGDDADSESFHVPEFIVSTASAFIVGMSAGLFAEHEPERRRGTLLMQGINDSIHGLAAHPRLPQLALSSYSGVVQLWDYAAKRLIMVRRFESEKLRPQCLTFARDGRKLVVGFTSGIVKVLHGHRLDDLASFRLGKAAITDVLVSPDSSLFVALDANLFLGMWRAKQVTSNPDGSDDADEWVYLGRCRAHSKPVTGLEFSRDGDGQPVLVSVSEDRTLAEYCLERSSILDGVVLKNAPTRVEQSAVPTACCWHPELRGVQEDLVIVVNDEYKLKQWNTGNQTCRKTTLGPSYGGPINRLVPVPLREDDQIAAEATGGVAERYCVYSTHEKVVGLLKLPLDGNPHKAMGLIAHPGKISNVDVTFDGSHLLTAGGDDLVVNMWEIHTHQLDLLEARGTPRSIEEQLGDDLGDEDTRTSAKNELGEDDVALAPYLALLEGGREGSFYHEIIDYFYLAQLRVQGEDATAAREITAQIPLREIPNAMRALGYYPTDEEIQHMVSEVRYSRFTETSRPVESIGLHDFIKLYVNHRPVFGVGKAQIERAFKILASVSRSSNAIGDNVVDGPATLQWDQLEARLLHSGEHMSEEELRSCLAALLVTGAGGLVMDSQYTALSFADKVLGFDDYEHPEGDEAGR
uniref:Cilia- and flagella-associated protein 251 n=1 Tax=Phytophthora ramorum TaxID=164328 RepID=H3GM44_PHYRM